MVFSESDGCRKSFVGVQGEIAKRKPVARGLWIWYGFVQNIQTQFGSNNLTAFAIYSSLIH